MKKTFNVSSKYLVSDIASTVVIHNGTLYLSGMVSINPETGEIERDSFKAQARRAFSNVNLALEEAGSNIDNVLKCTVYLSSMENFIEMNEVYKEFFKHNPPARVTVAVKELWENLDIEVSVIAAAEKNLEI